MIKTIGFSALQSMDKTRRVDFADHQYDAKDWKN